MRTREERLQQALLTAIRLGLNGDTASLEQHARNQLRVGADPVLTDAGRQELQTLLQQRDPNGLSVLR